MKLVRIFILLLLFTSVVAAEDYGSYNYIYIGDGFSVECPININIEQKAEAGFFIYSFNYNDQPILKAYSGLEPDLKKVENKNYLTEDGSINSCPCHSNILIEPNGNISGQVVISIMHAQELHTYLQYWYEHLTTSQLNLANQIINSTKPYISAEVL